jgi:hydroxypyruvate reductase
MTPQPDPQQSPKAFLRYLFETAVARAQPLLSMPGLLPPPPRGRTLVLGAGKAAGAMAHALERLWPTDKPLHGLVVTRYQHTPPRPEGLPQRIEIVEASHPGMDSTSPTR